MHKYKNFFICILIVMYINSSRQNNLTDCANSTCKKNETTQSTQTSINPGSCSCNLKLQICELNCCCDPDCTHGNRLIFDHCNEESEIADKRFCKNLHTSVLTEGSDFFENSLFCIVKNNLPPQYIASEHHVMRSTMDLNKMKNQYSWNMDNKTFITAEVKSYKTWKIGTKLWVLDRLGNIFALETPVSFMSRRCLFKNQAQFLVPAESQCYSFANAIFLNSLKMYHNASLINLPTIEHFNKTNFKECPRNICIPINIHVCSKNGCKNISEENIFNCTQCNVIVRQVLFEISHNGTEGMTNCTLKIRITNPVKTDKTIFKISYIWVNSTTNFSRWLSGNPGYLNNYPILVANFVYTKNFTTNQTALKIERSYNDFRKNFMVFPKNVRGKCLFDVDNYEPVEFGVNMLTKCSIKMNYFMGNNSNATNICQNMQRLIFYNWSLNIQNTNSTMIKKRFAQFGNANVSNEQDWKEVVYNIEPFNILKRVNGSKSNVNIICTNITSLMQLDLFYYNINSQQKITNIGVNLGAVTTLNLPINNNTLIINIPIEGSVMFYDITSKYDKKFIPSPSLEITLPYDFFYPFVKVKNAGVFNNVSIFLLVLQLVLIFCIK